MAIIYFISTTAHSISAALPDASTLQADKRLHRRCNGASQSKRKLNREALYTLVRGRECRRRQARGVQRWLCNSYINIFGQLCRPAETDQLGTRGEGGIPTLTLQYRGSPTIPQSCAAYITAALIERGVWGKVGAHLLPLLHLGLYSASHPSVAPCGQHISPPTEPICQPKI